LFLAAKVSFGDSLVSHTGYRRIVRETRWSLTLPRPFLAIALCVRQGRESPNRSMFYGEPAPLCNAGTSKIKGWVPLTLPQRFSGLLNQRFRSASPAFQPYPPAHFS
jgi:hypothetical protein